MLHIKFKYADALSNWEWREQECIVSSIKYGTYFLIHRFKHSDGYSEILCREDEVEIIDKTH